MLRCLVERIRIARVIQEGFTGWTLLDIREPLDEILGLRHPFVTLDTSWERLDHVVELVNLSLLQGSELLPSRNTKLVEDALHLWTDAIDDLEVVFVTGTSSSQLGRALCP